MAAESSNVSSVMEQLRSSFFPIIIGVMGPAPDSDPDRLVLVNPVTQGMIVLRGDASTISEILSAGGSGGGAPPASKASIEALKAVEVGCEEEECSVCLDGLKKEDGEGEVVKEMPCKHRFHGGCIEKWLKMHGSCPVCRFAMPSEEGEGGNKDERERRREREIWVTIAVRRSEREVQDQEDEQQE